MLISADSSVESFTDESHMIKEKKRYTDAKRLG